MYGTIFFDKFGKAIDVHITHDKVKRVYGKVYTDVKLNIDHDNAIYSKYKLIFTKVIVVAETHYMYAYTRTF